MVKTSKDIKAQKKQSLTSALILFVVIIAINIISQYYFTRIDLTSDKRYSLGDVSKEVLNDLDNIIYIKVYLDGELPPGIRKLKESTRELLDEMRAYGNNIEYEFIDPLESANKKEQQEIMQQLYERNYQIRKAQ